MKFPLFLAVAVLLAGELGSPAADSVELNGISCLGSQNLACLLLYQPARPEPLSFVLGEGDSKYGFKLVAVEPSKKRVIVEKCGVKRYVRINSTPDLIATNDPEAVAAAAVMAAGPRNPNPGTSDTLAVATYLASDDAARILAGHPLLPFAFAPGAGNAGNNGQTSSPGQNNTGTTDGSSTGNSSTSSNSGTSSSSGTQVVNSGINGGTSSGGTSNSSTGASANNLQNQVWYQESESIEASRIQTADQVLSGQMEPFPRTPLTPPGAPSQLVGQEVFFANYIPGFKETGYLNQ